MLYINRKEIEYILTHCPNKFRFENYDRKTIIAICYILIDLYQKQRILNNINK